MTQPVRLYSFPRSGNSHRVRLFAAIAGIDIEIIDVDLLSGEQRRPEFLKINPFGQVPVLQDGETHIADSIAILVYLARRYAPEFLPADPVEEAQVQQFLSIAAGELAFGPALARKVCIFGAGARDEAAINRANSLFTRIDELLANRTFLVAEKLTIADIALYTYTAHAPEGSIDLTPYTHIRQWLTRIESLPGFVPMPSTPAGLVA